ncbi:unannotated protein [freshwater metagenome]|uniref:Unannotated protein n=1 Tax=freshwater metagenome TaxID=449393 RepID=A0A6J7R7I0_9ZZZZ
MVFLTDLVEVLDIDVVVLVQVLHAGLREHARHAEGAEEALGGHDPPVAARRHVLRLAAAACPHAKQAHLAHLLDADRQPHVGLAGLDRQVHRTHRSSAGGARVDDVEHRDTGLTDLLLDLLTDARRGVEQRASAYDIHVLDGHAAVGERGQRRDGRQVKHVLVVVTAELGHVSPEDPDIVSSHWWTPSNDAGRWCDRDDRIRVKRFRSGRSRTRRLRRRRRRCQRRTW